MKSFKRSFFTIRLSGRFNSTNKGSGSRFNYSEELIKIVVQAKFYSSSVGNKAVQEVIASKSFYNADSCMVVTNNTFTSAALELAKVNNVKLIDGKELNNMIKIANLLLD